MGCSFDVWTKDRHILKVEPAEGPANAVSTCIKGKFAWDFVTNKDRLTKPLIREGDRFREAEWDEALDLIARRFGVAYHERSVGKLLKALGFSHISVRPRHPKQDERIVAAFKNVWPAPSARGFVECAD